jgi:hypothetical protein
MIAQVRRRAQAQIPPHVLHGQGAFLRAFGLLPADFDFEAGVYSLLESQLAGYYDHDDKVMFLMDDLSPAEAEATLAHELVHALQDQHYELAPKLAYRPEANDAQGAVQCLAEGDALSAMLDYLLAPKHQDALALSDRMLEIQIAASTALSPDASRFPPVLMSSLTAPYADGVKLVHALRRRGGWSAVDAVWRSPPASTEQVLHLEKLDAREPPESVPVPTIAPLGAGWRVAYSDVFGEQGLRIAAEEWMPRKSAAQLASGWGGDRAVVAEKASPSAAGLAAAWHLRFDRAPKPRAEDAEAVEAFEALSRAWESRSTRGAPLCRILPTGSPLAAVRRGRDLALVSGPHPESAPRAAGTDPCKPAVAWARAVVAER